MASVLHQHSWLSDPREPIRNESLPNVLSVDWDSCSIKTLRQYALSLLFTCLNLLHNKPMPVVVPHAVNTEKVLVYSLPSDSNQILGIWNEAEQTKKIADY